MQLSSGSDEVISRMILPSECKVLSYKAEIHGISVNEQDIHTATFIGFDGFIVPVEDPDSLTSWDTLWDSMIKKDEPISGADLELGTGTDASPFYNTGEPNINKLLDLNTSGRHWYKSRNMVSAAKRPVAADPSSTEENYLPSIVEGVNRGIGYTAEYMSACMVGVSVPDTAGEDTGIGSTPADETEWYQVKYVDMVLEQAAIALLGIADVPGEDPFETQATFLLEFLEPPVVEQAATTIIAGSWNIFTVADWMIRVPGRLSKQVIVAS